MTRKCEIPPPKKKKRKRKCEILESYLKKPNLELLCLIGGQLETLNIYFNEFLWGSPPNFFYNECIIAICIIKIILYCTMLYNITPLY